ncbi:glutaredoxin-like protein NrdH [Mycobacteroides abscessus]|uniref:glutaredoxin-like protein NrdH n=1 Tax=Mycobacteroides abscessus TaxID=36809 RepID=UPI0009414ACB|nr:glutaredoxin-like protein NrdH [Mycobacteroides abscessus]MDM2175292.1 glutaredoxin-like protein NrdH [Mycobacteroides abscessus]MDM2176322.1 glutaredoxin-like protein NrdH [Mycobacteroides abscessus]MDM2204887.1 glutaredoxin-like protein NrdH [Mycobacteroides abscessus]MDM2210472.1 glutaredoxin-like protein NrdH [Mycobacteroides abscessus]MDM2215806.1 glutaredoxin-like protein NrdH [Mycobacteroides abscessus]
MSGDTPTTAVTVYTKPGCIQCEATKKALKKNGVPYTIRDVTVDAAARDAVMKLGYSAAPVVVTAEGDHWAGFRPDRLKAIARVAA